jgi:hypothetical protein
MNKKEEIARIFSIFHDGGLDGIQCKGADLILQLGLTYLAERIQPEFNFFTLTLHKVKRFEFVPWSDVVKPFKDAQQIVGLYLEMNHALLENDEIHVVCLCNEDEFSGGDLFIDAESYEFHTEAGTAMTIEELAAISKDYWTRFASGE